MDSIKRLIETRWLVLKLLWQYKRHAWGGYVVLLFGWAILLYRLHWFGLGISVGGFLLGLEFGLWRTRSDYEKLTRRKDIIAFLKGASDVEFIKMPTR